MLDKTKDAMNIYNFISGHNIYVVINFFSVLFANAVMNQNME